MSQKDNLKSFSRSTITVNGKTYDSLDDVPQEQRELFRSMMDFAAMDEGVSQTTYRYNGVAYDSVEDMPQEAQDIFLNNDFSLAETFSDGHSRSGFIENKIKEIHNQRLSSVQNKEGFNSEHVDDSEPSRVQSVNTVNHDYDYSPAVQKQNKSYGWVSLVIIVAISAAVAWKAFS